MRTCKCAVKCLLLLLLVACPSREEAEARDCHQYPDMPQCPCRDYVGFVCRVDQHMVPAPSSGLKGSTTFYCVCDEGVIR